MMKLKSTKIKVLETSTYDTFAGNDSDPVDFSHSAQQGLPSVQLPSMLEKKLFEHQKFGVKWMSNLHATKRNGAILADDMGLGKTLQVSTFLTVCMMKKEGFSTAIVFAPKSVLPGWELELNDSLAPNIPYASIICINSEMTKTRRLDTLHRLATGPNTTPTVIIMSHQLGTSMIEDVAKVKWDCVVLDEGHVIKNKSTQLNKAMHQLNSPFRLLLTGTPIQNDFTEFWTLVDWVTKGELLGSSAYFKKTFADPIARGQDPHVTEVQREQAARARRSLMMLVKPYMLQRKKSDELQLPPKTELVLWIRLSTQQRQLYEQYTTTNSYEDMFRRSNGFPVEAIAHLKNICLHPLLEAAATRRKRARLLEAQKEQQQDGMNDLEKSFAEIDINQLLVEEQQQQAAGATSEDDPNEVDWGRGHFFEHLSRTPSMDEIYGGSTKIRIIGKMTKQMVDNGHRVLIFSMSKQLLDLLQYYFTCFKYPTYLIDGTTSMEQRQFQIDDFNNLHEMYSGPKIFLLATKACGVGINLVAADRVIIYDLSWNPAEDSQAVDRCYRIGQTKPVIVYRLAHTSCVEEKIYHKQVFKEGLRAISEKGVETKRYFKNKNEMKEIFTLGAQDHVDILRYVRNEMELLVEDGLEKLDSVVGCTRHDRLYNNACVDTAADDDAIEIVSISEQVGDGELKQGAEQQQQQAEEMLEDKMKETKQVNVEAIDISTELIAPLGHEEVQVQEVIDLTQDDNDNHHDQDEAELVEAIMAMSILQSPPPPPAAAVNASYDQSLFAMWQEQDKDIELMHDIFGEDTHIHIDSDDESTVAVEEEEEGEGEEAVNDDADEGVASSSQDTLSLPDDDKDNQLEDEEIQLDDASLASSSSQATIPLPEGDISIEAVDTQVASMENIPTSCECVVNDCFINNFCNETKGCDFVDATVATNCNSVVSSMQLESEHDIIADDQPVNDVDDVETSEAIIPAVDEGCDDDTAVSLASSSSQATIIPLPTVEHDAIAELSEQVNDDLTAFGPLSCEGVADDRIIDNSNNETEGSDLEEAKEVTNCNVIVVIHEEEQSPNDSSMQIESTAQAIVDNDDIEMLIGSISQVNIAAIVAEDNEQHNDNAAAYDEDADLLDSSEGDNGDPTTRPCDEIVVNNCDDCFINDIIFEVEIAIDLTVDEAVEVTHGRDEEVTSQATIPIEENDCNECEQDIQLSQVDGIVDNDEAIVVSSAAESRSLLPFEGVVNDCFTNIINNEAEASVLVDDLTITVSSPNDDCHDKDEVEVDSHSHDEHVELSTSEAITTLPECETSEVDDSIVEDCLVENLHAESMIFSVADTNDEGVSDDAEDTIINALKNSSTVLTISPCVGIVDDCIIGNAINEAKECYAVDEFSGANYNCVPVKTSDVIILECDEQHIAIGDDEDEEYDHRFDLNYLAMAELRKQQKKQSRDSIDPSTSSGIDDKTPLTSSNSCDTSFERTPPLLNGFSNCQIFSPAVCTLLATTPAHLRYRQQSKVVVDHSKAMIAAAKKEQTRQVVDDHKPQVPFTPGVGMAAMPIDDVVAAVHSNAPAMATPQSSKGGAKAGGIEWSCSPRVPLSKLKIFASSVKRRVAFYDPANISSSVGSCDAFAASPATAEQDKADEKGKTSSMSKVGAGSNGEDSENMNQSMINYSFDEDSLCGAAIVKTLQFIEENSNHNQGLQEEYETF